MEMTKQRKMLIGVLCVGVGGLMVDRLFLSAPDSAVAEQEDVVGVDSPSTPPALPLTGQAQNQALIPPLDIKTLPSYASLTERLILAQQQTDEQVPGRDDPFAVPMQWDTDLPKPLVNAQDSPSQVKPRITSLFKLDGTVRTLNDGKEELLAVVSGGGLDGVAIRVKQRIRVPNNSGPDEDYELVEVGSRYVVWMSLSTKERITMHVEQDY